MTRENEIMQNGAQPSSTHSKRLKLKRKASRLKTK